MYYFSQNGETSGPISEADLQTRIAAGSLQPTVNVWREGMAAWLPYNHVSGAATSLAAPPPLRVQVSPEAIAASHAAHQQPQFAGACEGENNAEVQGSTRFESASSWGMVVIVGLAMFVFIGVLASRPRDLIYANSSAAGVIMEAPDGMDAEVELKAGVLNLANLSDFGWKATTLSFKSGGGRYIYLVPEVPQDGKVAVPLSDFASTRGGKFTSTSSSANPRELTIRVQGHGSMTVEVETAP